MRYFEVLSPYYALIKAFSIEDFTLTYRAFVGDVEEDFRFSEVGRDYALVKLSRAPSEDLIHIDANDIVKDFNDPEIPLLLIDGSLL
jgi:hypothetical protein